MHWRHALDHKSKLHRLLPNHAHHRGSDASGLVHHLVLVLSSSSSSSSSVLILAMLCRRGAVCCDDSAKTTATVTLMEPSLPPGDASSQPPSPSFWLPPLRSTECGCFWLGNATLSLRGSRPHESAKLQEPQRSDTLHCLNHANVHLFHPLPDELPPFHGVIQALLQQWLGRASDAKRSNLGHRWRSCLLE